MKKDMLVGLSHREKRVKKVNLLTFSSLYFEKFPDFRIAGTVH